MANLKEVFQVLGYNSTPINFDKAVPYPKVRKTIAVDFAGTQLSLLLQQLPDLFVMHQKMVHGIFFVRLVERDIELSADALATYQKFYPKDLLLLWTIQKKKAVEVRCQWIDEDDEQSLVQALKSRFDFKPQKSALETLSRDGWLV